MAFQHLSSVNDEPRPGAIKYFRQERPRNALHRYPPHTVLTRVLPQMRSALSFGRPGPPVTKVMGLAHRTNGGKKWQGVWKCCAPLMGSTWRSGTSAPENSNQCIRPEVPTGKPSTKSFSCSPAGPKFYIIGNGFVWSC